MKNKIHYDNKFFPYLDDQVLIDMIRIINFNDFQEVQPIGDLVKNVPFLRSYQFLLMKKLNESNEDFNDGLVNYKGKSYTKSEVEEMQELVGIYLLCRCKPISMQVVSEGNFGLCQFYHNYNYETISMIRKRILDRNDEFSFSIDDQLYSEFPNQVPFRSEKEVFAFAEIDYFPPESELNI